ncbi:MAG TPA: transporter [Dyella sp.]|uniref:transporter n=1 Tax=Dyella sp. TaxID=1869338 RepID=UPI002D772633|nr:transporter [Dyella sp.]HET6554728.1 transporter [Dyella sp.]
MALALPLLALWTLALPARADNPGYDRPGLGFQPAVLNAGDVTIEQGLPTCTQDHDAGTKQSQYTTDTLLRMGLGGPFEIQLGTSLFNALHQTGMGQDSWAHGRGDTILGLKLAPHQQGDFTWGVLGSVEFTDGARDIRNDRRQYLLGGDFNWQLTPADAVGSYVEDVRSGGQDETTLAFSENHALTHALTGYVEAALVHDTGERSGTEAGAGLAWMVGQRVQLDGGVRHRLSGHAQAWMASLGVSVYFGH